MSLDTSIGDSEHETYNNRLEYVRWSQRAKEGCFAQSLTRKNKIISGHETVRKSVNRENVGH